MVVANQEFTKAARELAASSQVELWGRSKLVEVVLATQPHASSPKPTPIAATPSSALTCERCGRPMVLRESARGKFWGCSGFPKCRQIVPLGPEQR
ncbi:MAG TPA: topoisomerase DNA-binding C4 zinc finger domain-containing protein [Symbiobacteriaceae bacterium]|nr:topoisomerase DNA-binding C4 zinc finger domain-containing protein [Symbiobacteriaceae bacterium]